MLREMLLVLVFVGGGFYLLRRLFGQESDFKISDKVQVEVLRANDVISWFKKDDILKQIKENPDIQCVVIKGESVKMVQDIKNIPENKNYCMVALFDKKSSSVVTAQVFIYKEMEEDLVKMFGDKDMIVLS